MSKQISLAVLLTSLIVGSAAASETPLGSNRVSNIAAPPNAADAVADNTSASEGLVLRSAVTANDAELLSGGRFQLSGRLTAVAETGGLDDDGFICNLRSFDQFSSITLCNPQPQASGLFAQLATLVGQWGMCSATPEGECCSGDLDGDGLVGPADLHLMLSGC